MHFDRAGKALQFLQKLASMHLLGNVYIHAHPVFFKLKKACKCQARGSAEVSLFIMFPSFIFFLWETEKEIVLVTV